MVINEKAKTQNEHDIKVISCDDVARLFLKYISKTDKPSCMLQMHNRLQRYEMLQTTLAYKACYATPQQTQSNR